MATQTPMRQNTELQLTLLARDATVTTFQIFTTHQAA